MCKNCFVKIVSVISVCCLIFTSVSAFASAKSKKEFTVTSQYSINQNEYNCTLNAVYNSKSKGYDFSIKFDTIRTYTYSASISSNRMFAFPNSQDGVYMINNFSYWNVIADCLYKAYKVAYNTEFPGRTLEGMTRELRTHYDIYCYTLMLPGLDTIKNKAVVTDMGASEGNESFVDYNAFCFEEGKNDIECLLIYARDIYNISAAQFVINSVYSALGDEFWNNASMLISKATLALAVQKEDILLKK